MDRKELEGLMAAYRAGTLSPEGIHQLFETLNDPTLEDAWGHAMREEWDAIRTNNQYDEARGALLLAGLDIGEGAQTEGRLRRLSVRRIRWVWAASLAGILMGCWWIWDIRHSVSHSSASAPVPAHEVPRVDAADKVTLTLADGSKVVLDGVGDGYIGGDARSGAVKGGNSIDYAKAAISHDTSSFHTISTPKGGRFRITLSDGSRVWLNAASSIRFPVAFPSGVRKVEVTGQAYFEVSRHTGRPFHVKLGDASIEVLGTHFDVMAYPEEDELRTTLIEGSVRVRNRLGETLLKPGQQSYATPTRRPQVRDDVDIDRIMAWKEGVLEFHGDDIGSVCRALARAFDVKLVYEDAIQERFYARFPQDTDLETVLRVLEMTGKVHFKRRDGVVWATP